MIVASNEVMAPLWSEARGLPNLFRARTTTLPARLPSEYVPPEPVVASATASWVASMSTLGTAFTLGSEPPPVLLRKYRTLPEIPQRPLTACVQVPPLQASVVQ